MHGGILGAHIIWIPIEVLRLRSGYTGNINETFPELILFLGLCICSLVIDCVPFMYFKQRYPHELACMLINILFILFELVFGLAVVFRFIKGHFASFKLRTAPIIDRQFQKKYAVRSMDIAAQREIELGMQKFDK